MPKLPVVDAVVVAAPAAAKSAVVEAAVPAAVVPEVKPTVSAPVKKVAYEAKHFQLHEFACPCCGEAKVDDELLEVLDELREHFNSPVTVTSGFRCEKHNDSVGGKPGSQHKEGTASDVQVLRVPPRTVQKYLLAKYEGKYGLGCYRTFTHIDVRETEARW